METVTLRPEQPRTESIGRVWYDENHIYAYLDEKHDDFREIVKNRGLRWSYAGTRWERELPDGRGPVLDRAAELGHLLLSGRFIIQVEQTIADMIVNVSYEPEKRRWIRLLNQNTESRHYGKLFIAWPRDEDFYYQAKRLTAARYVKPGVAVAVDHYEEIEDFAERYGFTFTELAQAAVNQAKAERKQALVISVPPLPQPKSNGHPPERVILDVEAAAAEGVAAELLDD